MVVTTRPTLGCSLGIVIAAVPGISVPFAERRGLSMSHATVYYVFCTNPSRIVGPCYPDEITQYE